MSLINALLGFLFRHVWPSPNWWQTQVVCSPAAAHPLSSLWQQFTAGWSPECPSREGNRFWSHWWQVSGEHAHRHMRVISDFWNSPTSHLQPFPVVCPAVVSFLVWAVYTGQKTLKQIFSLLRYHSNPLNPLLVYSFNVILHTSLFSFATCMPFVISSHPNCLFFHTVLSLVISATVLQILPPILPPF